MISFWRKTISSHHNPAAAGTHRDRLPVDSAERTTAPGERSVRLRSPRADDGPAVSALIAASPPLDGNSAYCNLLQCSDFADTCILAERGGAIVGWISGYRLPARPDELFIWQVAVACEARGEGLGSRMLDALLERTQARWISTTVTVDNHPSAAMFASFARRHGAAVGRSQRFEKTIHFAGAHATEWQFRIGPIAALPAGRGTENREKLSA